MEKHHNQNQPPIINLSLKFQNPPQVGSKHVTRSQKGC